MFFRCLYALILAVTFEEFIYGQNPVQIENAISGTPGWQLSNPAVNREIEGYASLTSVNIGGTIAFSVSTTDSTFNIDIFRTGWYAGVGARLLATIANLHGVRQTTPTQDPVTRLIECAWPSSYVLTVPATWVSGIYLARLTGNQSGKQSWIIFVVRDDSRSAALLFENSVTTYQAYNFWPNGATGRSLYAWGNTSDDLPAWKVSFNRPYVLGRSYSATTSGAAFGVGAGEYLANLQPGPVQNYGIFNAGYEYNMVRWLEKNGYDVTYLTDIDVNENAALLKNHRALLSVGHNEYWSMPMLQNVQKALANGLSLGFFSANSPYWQVRFEPASDGAPDRTMVGYKYDAPSNDPLYNSNPQLSTVRWRDPHVNLPEAAWVGAEYVGDPFEGDIVISDASHWLMDGAGLHNGDRLTGLLGYEVDAIVPGISPTNIQILASSPVGPFDNDYDNPPGLSCNAQVCNANVTWYSAGHAFVFDAGSMNWSWGLDDYNATSMRPAFSSAAAQTITRNVLAAFINPVTVATASLPAGVSGASYTPFQLTASGGGQPYAWTASGLPSGMSLSPAGMLSGTPASSGSSQISFTVTDAASHTGSATLMLAINAPQYTISGQITASGTGLSGVTVALSGAASAATTTGGNGNYSFTGLRSGTYTVTPSRTGYTFTPPSQTFTNMNSSQTASFTASAAVTYVISGRITRSGIGLGSVTVALSGASTSTTSTTSSGSYSFSGLASGTYTVAPARSGYAFTPTSRTFTNMGSSQTANFTATVAVTYTISGRITDSGAALSGVTVALSGASSATTTTSGTGSYSFAGLSRGTYTVTPSRGGYTFTPPSRTFSNISSSQTANFTAAAATVSARAVSIDFTGSGVAMSASESAGVVAKTNWNNAAGNASGAALALKDETGLANGATVTWISDNNWALPITDTAGNARMMRGYLDTGNQNPSTIGIAGLPLSPTGYDVYVYTDGDNDGVTVTGAYAIGGAGIATTSVKATDAPNANFNGAFTQAVNSIGNYVKFSSIQAAAFTITATPATASDGNLRAPVNAIQIVPSPSPVTARTVSIKFVGSGAAMSASESAGVVPKTNWNNAANNASSAPLALKDEAGVSSGALVTWTSDNNWALPIADTAGNARMMRGYLDTGNQNPSTISVTGLPASAAGYDVYVYTDGDNEGSTVTGTYTIGGSGVTTSSVQATDSANVNFNGTFTQAANSIGNYVKFSSIQATDFTITATPTTASTNVLRAPVNAIQIVPH
jgi:hypothetical protein